MPLALLASVVLGIALAIPAHAPALFAQGTCPGDGAAAPPIEVTVTAVPIVVASTTADYFVLYVEHDVDGGTLEQPVAVVLGEDGTTTLTENVEALPTERYRVEKYLVADPADVDGDCVDDISELADSAGMNPVNPAAAIDISSGAVIIPDRATFDTMAADLRGGQYLKFIVFGMNSDRMGIYFVTTEPPVHHYLFVNSVGLTDDDTIRGNIGYDPDLIAPNGSKGLYFFWMELNRSEIEYYSFTFMARIYSLLAASMRIVNDDLVLFIDSDHLEYYQTDLPLFRESRIDLRFRDDIFGTNSFRVLNPGEAVGRLRVLDPDDLPHPRDIVIYEALPNELPRVAGVISTVPQTPLSHVNLRAIQNGMPNSYIRDALDDPAVSSLRDTYVRYIVSADGYWTMHAATAEEVAAHYASSRPATAQTPQRDLSVTSITALRNVNFDDWRAFGVKAANVAVLGKLGFPQGTVPDGFAIPFYFYDEFMKHNGFYDDITAMLNDPDFQMDFDVQERRLTSLREAIEDASTPDWIIAAIETMNESFPDDINKRYRSSTNNEDLPGFNGAGLYDSKSQKPDEDEEDPAKSLKEVYASLWNFRAFSEREFHRIDHMAAAMGILVHPSYQDERVNGVAVSFSPFDPLDDVTFYVNSQAEEILVTNPPAHSLPEEILVTAGGNINVIGLSNKVMPGQLLMTKAQRAQLHSHLGTIQAHFTALYNPAPGERFAMEIEFKITNENALAIKQARPWVFETARTSATPAPNTPPRFRASITSRSVPENTPRGEDIGTPIAAADNDALRYALSGDHASSFSIDQNTGQLRTNAALDYETRPSYSVTVTVTDPSATSDSIAVTINVTDRNEPPAFPHSLRAPLSVDENTDAERNIGGPLTAIDEDDGDSLIYSLDSASDAVFGIDPGKGLLRTEAPLNHEATDSYRVVVQVSDGDDDDGKPDPAIDDTLTLTVRVNDRNEPPVVSGEASISYAEDRTDPVASYAHNDPDENASITWSLSGPDAGDFAIDGSGVLSFAGPPDHDDPRDSNGDNEYHVTVSASDGSLRDSLDVRVTVSGVNERPQLSGPAAVSYREDRTDAVASYAHNDPDQPPTITWSLSGPDVRHFDFDDDSGELTFRETPDHEHARDANGDNDYQLTITASDGTLSDSLDVTVTVSDVNEPPTLTGRSNIPVDEHGDGFVTSYQADDPDVDAVLGWTVAGSDAGHFRINQEGELRFGEEPDFESPRDTGRNNVYNLTVRVFDGVNTPALNVTVPVRNVDEAGQVSVSSIQPQVGASLTAALKDPDGSITSQSWQWQSSTDRSAWSDIVSATTRGYTPVPTDEGIFLRVTVSYTDGHGPGKTATTVLDAVGALPAANARPTFPPTETGLRSIPENTPAGQPIGDPVSALDDSSDRLTYALDSAGDAIFDIVADTGQLLTDAPLDHEQPGSRTVTVTVTATDPSGARATLRVTITVEAVDEPPELSGDTVVSIPANSARPVATYSATDPEGAPLIWRLEGRDAGAFDLVDGVLSFLAPPDFESPANAVGSNTYRVTIAVSDGTHSVTRDVAVVVIDAGESARAITGSPTTGVPISTGGGPSGPTPSDVDFEWTVTRDIEELDSGHDTPTGMWSDGRVLWVAENGPGADDEIYAYDLESGERLEDAEFELAETNRAPRGFWSDGEAVWVSDSGQDRLFAYELESGERLDAREFELARRNGDPRGLWSDGETVWVLDGRRDALFAYELESGVLLGEYALASSNGDPHGVWSDGVTVWVSDHGAKRLFAYRLPAAPEGPAADDADVTALERVGSEEFAELSKASNNSPRGLWSDGAVMYVADESDDRVYSYNMPDAIDARLASLSLSGVDIGDFDRGTVEYEGMSEGGATQTTVEAQAAQHGARVVIDPPDADVETEGHQVGVDGGAEVTVTVTSPDGSRGRVYRVTLGESGASASCLRGDVAVGFSLLLYEGGSVDELVACAESRHVRTLYGGTTVPYVIGAPGFVNRSFVARFAAGLPAGTPLLATSEGPASPDPAGGVPGNIPPAPWPECLRGDGAPGFSLVLYEGGSVEELVECAASRGVPALYTLDDGEWVSYIAGAPEFVNRPFRELFAAGVPAVTPLLARGN